ncbi:hypothetical protein [Marinagarivorans algicola]|uniref:hypothetical protein n=1 Tax=Marinagarivorans algicola TaxID=1513270 RepID=UPI0006B509A8|nr:hypothetical protein [Marinagarivorans algicola]
MKIISRWLELCSRFDALVVRERVLLFGSCLAGLYLVFDTLLILPTSAKQALLTEEMISIQKKIDQIATEKKVFDRVAQRDPDANLKRERLKLQGRLLQLEGGLEELSLRLIASEQLPEILREVSKSASQMNLKSLRTLPPEAIDLSGKVVKLKAIARAAKDYLSGHESDDSEDQALPSEKVYRHAIRLRLEGTYFEVMEFLQVLENLTWRFYWEGIDYKVAQFPNAIVEIELYTLSTDEGMLGEQ